MIIVNGKEINLTEDTTVAEYLEQNQYQVKKNRCRVKWRYSSEIQLFRYHVKRRRPSGSCDIRRRRLTFMEETGLENMTENTEKKKST